MEEDFDLTDADVSGGEDREDEQAAQRVQALEPQSAIPVGGDQPPPDLPASDAIETQLTRQPQRPKVYDYEDWMSPTERRAVDALNRRNQTLYNTDVRQWVTQERARLAKEKLASQEAETADRADSASGYGKAFDQRVEKLHTLKEKMKMPEGPETNFVGIKKPGAQEAFDKKRAEAEIASNTYAREYYRMRSTLMSRYKVRSAKAADEVLSGLGFTKPDFPVARPAAPAAQNENIPVPQPRPRGIGAPAPPAPPAAISVNPSQSAASGPPPAAAPTPAAVPPPQPAPNSFGLKPLDRKFVEKAQSALKSGAPRDLVVQRIIAKGMDPRSVFKPLSADQLQEWKRVPNSVRNGWKKRMELQGFWVPSVKELMGKGL